MAKVGFGGQILNAFRSAALSPEEKRGREAAKLVLELVKLTAVVATAVAGVFLFAFPGIFSAIGFTVTALLSNDSYMIASNFIEVLDHASVEYGTITDEAKITQIIKNTLITGPIIRTLIAIKAIRG